MRGDPLSSETSATKSVTSDKENPPSPLPLIPIESSTPLHTEYRLFEAHASSSDVADVPSTPYEEHVHSTPLPATSFNQYTLSTSSHLHILSIHPYPAHSTLKIAVGKIELTQPYGDESNIDSGKKDESEYSTTHPYDQLQSQPLVASRGTRHTCSSHRAGKATLPVEGYSSNSNIREDDLKIKATYPGRAVKNLAQSILGTWRSVDYYRRRRAPKR